jgi:hypothetical protein
MLYVNALLSFLCLLSIVAILYGPWQSVCTDVARQLIFEQRDKLFDMAKAGRISFSSREYKDVRRGLEVLIRFAHDLTLAKAIYLAIAVPRVWRENRQDPIIASVNRIVDEELRRDVIRLVAKSYLVLILMAIAKSIICLIAIPIAILFVLLTTILSVIVRWYKPYFVRVWKPYIFKIGNVIQAEADVAG